MTTWLQLVSFTELKQTDFTGSSKVENSLDKEHPNKLRGDEGASIY